MPLWSVAKAKRRVLPYIYYTGMYSDWQATVIVVWTACNEKNSELHPSRWFKQLNNDASSNFTGLDFMKLFRRSGDMLSILYTEFIYQ
jgi:hypothetical protein